MSNQTQRRTEEDDSDIDDDIMPSDPQPVNISTLKKMFYPTTFYFNILMFFGCAFLGFLLGWLQNWQLQIYNRAYLEAAAKECGTKYVHSGLWTLAEIKEADHQMLAYYASGFHHLFMALNLRHYVHHGKDPFDWQWYLNNKCQSVLHLGAHGWIHIFSLVRHIMQIESYFNLPEGSNLGFAGGLCFFVFLVQATYYTGWAFYSLGHTLWKRRQQATVTQA